MNFDVNFAIDTFWIVLGGAKVTLLITVVSLLISIPFGFMISLLRLNRIKVLDKLSSVYVSFIRGTPMIVQIYLIYYICPKLLVGLFSALNLSINIYNLNPIIYAYVVFSLNTSAVLSEVFRSALGTVEGGQYEASLAVGLSSAQSYVRIIIPQALLVAIPNLCTTTVNLIKGTSLVFAMTVQDITAKAKIEAAEGYKFIEAYLDVFIVYIIICFTVEKLFKLIESRLNIYKRKLA